MLINQLSKASGISIATIRFYVKLGLIKGKAPVNNSSNNYIQYTPNDVEKLELINYAKDAGFTLTEIAKLIEIWYSNKLSVGKKISVLQTKMKEIDTKINELKAMRKLITSYIKDIENGEC
jgi:MerR family transcriptional regulator, copper efflux regulator